MLSSISNGFMTPKYEIVLQYIKIEAFSKRRVFLIMCKEPFRFPSLCHPSSTGPQVRLLESLRSSLGFSSLIIDPLNLH